MLLHTYTPKFYYLTVKTAKMFVFYLFEEEETFWKKERV